MKTPTKTLRFILAGSILAALHAQAAVLYWDGAGSNDNWDTLENWGTTGVDSLSDPGAIPTIGDEVVFYSTGGARLTTGVINAPFTINSLTFGNGQSGNVQVNSGSQTLTLDGTANYEASNFSSGAAGSLGTVGLFVQSGFGTVTLGTASGFVVINAAQNWINNSSTSVDVKSQLTYTGLLTFNSGSFTLNAAGTAAAGAKIATGSTVINASTGAIFGTGTLDLNGGTLRNSTAATTRTLANALSITGDSTLDAAGATGNNTFTGAVSTTGNRILTVNTSTTSFTTSTLTLGGNLTVNGTGKFTTSGGINLNGSNRTLTFDTAANAVNLSGAINDSVGAGTKLVLSGSGTNITVGPLSAGADNSPLIEVNGTGTYTFANGSTHPGGTTLVSGKIRAGGNTAFAAGPLVLSGGTLASSAAGGGGDRTFANATTINGTVALGDSSFSGYTMAFTGTTTFDSNAVISNTNNNGVTFSTGSSVLTTGFTVNLGATPSAVTFSGGFTVPGAVASDNRTISLNNGATAVNISGSLVGSAASQTITLTGTGTNNNIGLITSGANTPGLIVNGAPSALFKFGSASTFNGGVTLTNSIAEVTIDTTGTVTNGPLGTGTVTMNGGTIRPGSGADRSLANALAITGGTSTFAASNGSGRALTFSGTTTISGSPTLVFSNDGVTTVGGAGTSARNFTGTVSFNSDTAITANNTGSAQFGTAGSTINLNGNLAVLMNSTGPISLFTNATGTINLGGASRTVTIDGSGSGVFQFSSPGLLEATAPGLDLILAGSNVNSLIGSFKAGANSPRVVVNSTTGGMFTFNGGSGTYAGGTLLTSGTLRIASSSTGGPPPTSGPLGVGSLTLNGGILRTDATQTIGNSVVVGGSTTISSAGNPTSSTFTLSGPVSLNSGAVITYTNVVTNSVHAISGLVTLNAASTVNLNSTAGTGTFATWSGGLDLNNGNRTLTVSGTATRALAISGTVKDTGGTAHNLTINGTNNVTASALISAGTGNPGLIYSGTGTMDLADKASTWTGGYTMNSGITSFAASSTLTGGNQVLNSPFGTGTITLNGGWLAETSNSQTLHNSLVLSGTVIIASIVNPGNSLTFNPTAITTPSAGSITVSGATTIHTNHAGTNNLTLTGPITGASTPSLTIKGFNNGTGAAVGTVTITNAGVASTFGALSIGESVASGSAGGRVQLNGASSTQMQNALGSGAIAINYGGTLTYGNQGADLNPTNAITVGNGGTFAYNPALGNTMTNAMVFNSGATLNSGNKTLTLSTATATLPTAGVLFVTGNQTTALTTAYPSFTGTMAFGGASSSGSTTTFAAATTLSSVAASARTLAFNQSGGGNITFSSGLTLNANLTLAGTGNAGVSGAIGQGSAGSLGTVTGGQALTVNLAPTGVVSVTQATTGISGIAINSGTLAIDGGNTASIKAGGGTITLNGGTIRNQNSANNNSTWNDNISAGASGGTIESFSTGNAQIVTFAGAITGSSSLTLRVGGVTSNTSSIVLAPTSASAYSGTITLATSGGRGRVSFNANSLAGLAAGGVTVTAGTTFGVDAIGTLTGNIAKFTLNADSILSLDNISGSNIDLSATGINKDIRVGGTGVTISAATTLTPFGSTYKFSPAGSFTVSATNWLFGANDLDVRAGAIAPGAYGVASNTLAFNNAQSFSGTTTVAGVVNNSLMGTGTTGPTLNFSNTTGTTGTTTVSRGGTLQLLGTTGALANISTIVVRSGGIFQDGDGTAANNNAITNRIASAVNLTLGGTDGGGTFRMAFPAAGTHAQTLNSLALSTGSSTISTANTAAGALNLTFSAASASVYSRSTGSVLNFTLPTTTATPTAFSGGVTTVTIPTGLTNVYAGMPITGTGLALGTRVVSYTSGTGALVLSQATSAANAATALTYVVNNGLINFTNAPTGSPNVIGGLLAGAFINSSDFVAANSGAIVAPSYTFQSAAGSWTAGQNISSSINTALIGTTSGTLAINSLRNSAANNGTVTIGASGSDSLTISSGMILHTPANSLNINGPGTLTSGNGQDLTFNVQQNTLTVAAQITGGLALTKLGGGTLTLSSTGNAIGDVYALGGTIIVNAAGALPTGTTRTINLMGGTVQFAAPGAFPATTSINVGAAGGNMNANANGALSFAGNVQLNGAMTISSPGGGSPTTATYSGTLSGAGMVLIGKQSDGKNTTIVTGDNSTWTGGVRFDTGSNAASGNSHLRFAPAVAGYTSSGTGPIFLTGGNTPGGIYFDTAAAGSTTFSNDIINNFAITPIVAWGLSNGLGTGTANTTTLSGRLVGTQGLFLQGYATGDTAISETVLSGTVSVSGTASGYSYGTATAAQNFNNGQGGITLGTTGFRGVTAQGTGNVGLPDLPVGQATNGAEGFVRFSGANSFIPGAVGPGYLSALRKAGGGQNGRFGYLLTGGSTYALPEGKSFLLGSLGTGTQQFGTLGAAGSGTATLLGGAKAAAGQLLAGFTGGDINIHANAAADTQSLNLLARAAGDTLVLGSIAKPIVFTPTYGDSGITSAITLLSKRTGATTLNKIGDGLVNLAAIAFTHTDGTSATADFSWNVTAGTLQSPDGGSLANSVTLNGGTLQASGPISYANAVTAGANDGTINTNGNTVTLSGTVGGAGNTLTKTGAGTLNFAVGSTLTTLQDLVANNGTTNVNSTLGTGGNATVSVTGTTTLKFGSVSQTLSSLSIGAGATVTFTSGLASFSGGSGGGKTPSIGGGSAVVPEPGTLGLLLVGALGLLNRRRRQA